MKRVAVIAGVFAVAAAVLLSLPRMVAGGDVADPIPAPEFPERSQDEWLNSAPLTLSGLRGHVVLLDFWTFDCWNCYRSFPWLNALEARLEPGGLKIIGIHSPEFEHEKVRDRVAAKIREFGIRHPVMIDNDFSFWRAMGNRYWPSWYLVDKRGNVRAAFAGETHEGDRQAEKIESAIRELLAEDN